MTALDLGCGAGCEAVFLASLGVNVVGVDSSVVALEIARRRSAEAGLEVEWRLGDAGALPVESDSVDFALDRGCFHVISEDRREDYGRELLRVLKPGGALLLRGAAEDDDEEGVVGVSDYELQRCFGELGLRCGPLVPLTLTARSGDLAGRLVVVRRPAG
jgi:ubiquinone/menaquinone biosynthesis C-methylase UbiE